MWYLITSWKLLSENFQALPRKNPLPPKNSKSGSPPLFAHLQKGGGGGHYVYVYMTQSF